MAPGKLSCEDGAGVVGLDKESAMRNEKGKRGKKKKGHGAMYEYRMMRKNHTPVW